MRCNEGKEVGLENGMCKDNTQLRKNQIDFMVRKCIYRFIYLIIRYVYKSIYIYIFSLCCYLDDIFFQLCLMYMK